MIYKKRNGMKQILATLLLSIMVLTGCDQKDLVQWSPDGKRVAIIASGGVRVGDEKGKLSQPVLPGAKFCRWLPDSTHAIVVSTKTTSSWKEVNDLLSPKEHQTVKQIAEKAWASRALPKTKTSLEQLHQ